MKSSKRMSALAVFRARKEKEETDSRQLTNENLMDMVNASSSASLSSETKKKNKGLLRFIKGSLKGSRKSRAYVLPDTTLDSSCASVKRVKRKSSQKNQASSLKKAKHDWSSNNGGVSTKKEKKKVVDGSQNQAYMYNSYEEAKKLFEYMLHPVTLDKFFGEMWEKKPLVVRRHIEDYNDGWFTTTDLDRILREENILFTTNLDVTTYENNKRETHNPVGRAHAAVVWDYFQNGCSVRLLNPQAHSQNVWKQLSLLQEYFGCFVGANIYLTPPGSQGFAPHYDDIEAFVLQLEGSKHWTLYAPRNESEVLSRYPSENINPEDLGDPLVNVVLNPGDILYFPRGTIHQAKTSADSHSLHITVSCCQKNTWGDLLEKLIPKALEVAMEEDINFRKSLPVDYLSYMGMVHSDVESQARKKFYNIIESLMASLITKAPVDAACDQMGKQLIHQSLPPALSKVEKAHSIHNQGERWDHEEKQVVGLVSMKPDTAIKLIRRGVIRMVTEDEQVKIYHCLENTKVFCQREPQYLEVSIELAPAVEYLIHAYPDFVTVDSLPLDTSKQQIEVACALYESGMLLTEGFLKPVDDEEDEDSSEEEQ